MFWLFVLFLCAIFDVCFCLFDLFLCESIEECFWFFVLCVRKRFFYLLVLFLCVCIEECFLFLFLCVSFEESFCFILFIFFIVCISIYECFGGVYEGKSSCCGVVFRYMFGGLVEGGGRARSSGVSSSPVSVIVMSLENSSICFFTTSWRLELRFFA